MSDTYLPPSDEADMKTRTYTPNSGGAPPTATLPTTAIPPAPVVASSKISLVGALIVSMTMLIIFCVALVFAWVSKNAELLNILVAVIATNVTSIIGFWVGSSSSSQQKDITIASHASQALDGVAIRK